MAKTELKTASVLAFERKLDPSDALFEQSWALIALLGWLTVVALAFRQRRRWPLLAMAGSLFIPMTARLSANC